MGLLIDGEWRSAPPSEGDSGDFVRQTSTFRHQITADGSSGFKAAPGRYHLYVSRACPWCHRTMIYRVLKRLENVISISYVEPLMLDHGWTFPSPEPLTGSRYVYELYQRRLFASSKRLFAATADLYWALSGSNASNRLDCNTDVRIDVLERVPSEAATAS